MLKAVIVGTAHMHVNEVALYLKNQPDFELVGVADVKSGLEEIPAFTYTPLWNLKNVEENYCSNVYEDYKTMLDELKPDIAFILTENAMKPEIVEECAKRGVNVSIEKPLAVNYSDALKIQESINKYGIEAVVNWPVMWRPYMHKFKATLDSGIVGKPLKLRYINGHPGPLGKGAKHRGVTSFAEEMTDEQRSKTWWYKLSHGGGVFADISCYGCYMSEWIFGKGKEVLAFGTNLNTHFGDGIDDDFAAVIQYDDVVSVIEGEWITARAAMPSGPMVLCSDGFVTCTGAAEGTPDVKAYDLFSNEIEIPDIEFEDKYKDMPWHYANHIKTGEPIAEMLTIEKNMEIVAMMDAILRAAESRKTEKI